MTRKAFVVYVDLDDVPGEFHTQESALHALRNVLRNTIGHYNPMVSLAPETLQPEIVDAEAVVEDGKIVLKESLSVRKPYDMNPETDDLIRAHRMRNGMCVRPERPSSRDEWNRWVEIEQVEREDNTIHFIGQFEDGKKASYQTTYNTAWFVKKDSMPTDVVHKVVSGPHSRACGPYSHEHGSDCHENCPTCHGRHGLTSSDLYDSHLDAMSRRELCGKTHNTVDYKPCILTAGHEDGPNGLGCRSQMNVAS